MKKLSWEWGGLGGAGRDGAEYSRAERVRGGVGWGGAGRDGAGAERGSLRGTRQAPEIKRNGAERDLTQEGQTGDDMVLRGKKENGLGKRSKQEKQGRGYIRKEKQEGE
ncbi:hypothetical protein Pmani_021165 [Petrolisthes manimaculis]|uniref:Uncharacterized protein n=1 Tax=Petrolisthes manimaculis TaxID=1843537 RepID=A0AAE1PEP5_9EUCA|nr:hypothetical protein Pmani_021165 [Petrolisthes manimaculis]